MHKRNLFVTNSSSCCQFIWGFELPDGAKVNFEDYVNYMRRTHEEYHSANEYNLPVQIEYVEGGGNYVAIDASVVRVHDDDSFRFMGNMNVGEDWDARIIEFCDAVGLQRPTSNELGWYGGIAVC
jgi:hypothetical protein